MSTNGLERLKMKREVIRSSLRDLIQRITQEIEKSEIDLEFLEESLEQLNVKDATLKELDSEIEGAITDLNELEREVRDLQEFYDQVIRTKTRVTRVFRNAQERQSSGSNRSTRPTVSLPKLNIDKFKGELQEWQTFWSRFEIAVHQRETLAKAEKFAYLKSYLEGQAANAVAGLPITEENYDVAVDILTTRFGRKDIIINSYMNKLLSLNPVRRVSDIQALRRLYDTCETQIRGLEALGVATESHGNLLCPVLMKIIPEEITLEFSRRKDAKGEWNVRDLLSFLQTEIESRERAAILTGTQEAADSRRDVQNGTADREHRDAFYSSTEHSHGTAIYILFRGKPYGGKLYK